MGVRRAPRPAQTASARSRASSMQRRWLWRRPGARAVALISRTSSHRGQIGKLAGREAVQPVLPQDMDARPPVEQAGDGGIAHIESAGIGPERRQDEAPLIADEAATADPPAAPAEGCLGMEMARNLAGRGRGRGDMAEKKGSESELRLHQAAQIGRRGGIVIARDPDPATGADEAGEVLAIGTAEALCSPAVMEAVAEADHGFGVVALDGLGKPG